jgi:hypothetical protein
MRFINGSERNPKNKRTPLIVCGVFFIIVLIAIDIWAIFFRHLSLSQIILINLFFLVVLLMPFYFALTKDVEKLYDQPPRKYLVRFIFFPLGIAFCSSLLLWLRVPIEVAGILFLIAYAGVRIYFHRNEKNAAQQTDRAERE